MLVERSLFVAGQEVQFFGDPDCSYFMEFPTNNGEHDDIFSAIEKTVGQPDTIVDVGANFGLFSVGAALRFPNSRIISYEPLPNAFSALAKNCSAFSNRIEPRNSCVGVNASSMKFFPGGPINSNRSSGAHIANENHWKSDEDYITEDGRAHV